MCMNMTHESLTGTKRFMPAPQKFITSHIKLLASHSQQSANPWRNSFLSQEFFNNNGHTDGYSINTIGPQNNGCGKITRGNRHVPTQHSSFHVILSLSIIIILFFTLSGSLDAGELYRKVASIKKKPNLEHSKPANEHLIIVESYTRKNRKLINRYCKELC